MELTKQCKKAPQCRFVHINHQTTYLWKELPKKKKTNKQKQNKKEKTLLKFLIIGDIYSFQEFYNITDKNQLH